MIMRYAVTYIYYKSHFQIVAVDDRRLYLQQYTKFSPKRRVLFIRLTPLSYGLSQTDFHDSNDVGDSE